jgi:8-oxo-dGTP pyrophosphatase MutT (NUDIX family)
MIRLAVRALILRDDRLLVVNAYPSGGRELWFAPGGGVEPHVSLPDNLAREVHEETGLSIAVGPLRLVNEFHDPEGAYHQVDLMFRATVTAGDLDALRLRAISAGMVPEANLLDSLVGVRLSR